jgi:penicillin-insensitive murein endopeptidase
MLWPIPLLLLSIGAAPDSGASDASAAAPSPPVPPVFDPRWNHVATPKPGSPRAIGQPGSGCLQGAAALPLRGAGWIVVHPERHRQFGHPSLIAWLRTLAAHARREKLGVLHIGDLGQPRGGPTPSGHRSHQNGLDADVWYEPPPKAWSPGRTPAPAAPSVVDMRTNTMLPAWNKRVARLIEIAASDPTVDRIFVHPAVKRALCQDKPRRGPWLQRVRPWWGHQDHFHVRLRCPADSPDCIESQPLPAGEGCDVIAWWFSADAHAAAAKRGPPGEGTPAMPDKCEAVLGSDGEP